MNSRHELHNNLVEIMDNKKVYFQPPESIKLAYPCIIYKLNNIRKNNADNIMYTNWRGYSITLIDTNPDSIYVDRILELPYCSFDRSFVSNNLHHFVFTIYVRK